ncbi:DUF2563 family protein [Mycolicibacterium sp. CH28]|nr:DUF2563 family protein [Mycolicibacterium sp. CH28]
MQVDVEEMRSGANRSYNAAWLAMEGADQLSRTRVTAAIFGDFAAAEAFHGALGGPRERRAPDQRQRRGSASHDSADGPAGPATCHRNRSDRHRRQPGRDTALFRNAGGEPQHPTALHRCVDRAGTDQRPGHLGIGGQRDRGNLRRAA